MIKIAVIGAGHWGPNLINNFNSFENVKVKWVIDLNEQRLDVIKSKYPEIELSTDLNQVFNDKELNGVVITTPTKTHHELSKKALESDLHVLVEKPITDNVLHAQELLAISQERKRILMVGHVFMYNNAVNWIKDYLTQDSFGKIYYLSMVRTNLGPIRTDVNAAWDLASHDISIANYLLNSSPVAVSATGGNWLNPGIEDAVFITLRYPQNILVRMDVSWIAPVKIRDITIVGENQMLTFNDNSIDEPVKIYNKGVKKVQNNDLVDNLTSFKASIRKGDSVIPAINFSPPLSQECRHFIECIEKNLTPRTNAAQGICIVEVLEAISKSIKNNSAEITL